MKYVLEMSMFGELTFYLGMQILQKYGGIFICQEKYLKDMSKKFQMDDYKPVSTPMEIGCNLYEDDESLDVDQNIYRSMIGSFLCLKASRPDIMLDVRLVA